METTAAVSPAEAKQARIDDLCGKAARARGFVTEDQLHECEDMQVLAVRHLGRRIPLLEIMFLRGALSVEQMRIVLAEAGTPVETSRRAAPRGLLGQIAVESGFCTREELLRCLDAQAAEVKAGKPPRPLGEILVSEGCLKDEQLQEILRLQKGQRK